VSVCVCERASKRMRVRTAIFNVSIFRCFALSLASSFVRSLAGWSEYDRNGKAMRSKAILAGHSSTVNETADPVYHVFGASVYARP